MLLPYNLCGTVIQLMLLGHDRTTCVVRSVTYDIMSLLGTYVRLCAVAGHNLLIETWHLPIGETRFALWYGAPGYELCRNPHAWVNNIIKLTYLLHNNLLHNARIYNNLCRAIKDNHDLKFGKFVTKLEYVIFRGGLVICPPTTNLFFVFNLFSCRI
jgi:hypothetical protein